MKLKLFVHRDHFIYIDVPKANMAPLKVLLLEHLQDPCLLGSPRHSVIIALKGHYLRCPAYKIQLQHLVELPVVHVDRPRMELVVGLGLIHLGDLTHGPASLLAKKQFKPGLIHVPQTVIPRRKSRS